jgi:hypothetical protein
MGCLEQIPVAKFVRFAERSANDGSWDPVKKYLNDARSLLRQGEAKLRNAASVSSLSSLEDLARQGAVHDQLREMMSPELRQGWDEDISCLEMLLGKRSA